MKPFIRSGLIVPFVIVSNLFSQDGVKPIIDMHLHDYTKQTYFVAPAPDGTMSPGSLVEYRKQVKVMLKKYNVIKAVVSTIGGENNIDDDLFIPGYYTSKPPENLQDFEKLIDQGKIKVFGEIGAVYDGLTLSDKAFEPYLKLCETKNIPVAVHTGGGPPGIAYRCCPDFRVRLGDPYLVEDVLVKFPNLKVYLMHAGEVFYEHTLRLMTQYPKLYVDLGVLLWVDEQPKDYAEQFLRKAKSYGLLDRVMFGSDQMVWPHAIEKSILQLERYVFLTEEEKRKIFYHNAVVFLGL